MTVRELLSEISPGTTMVKVFQTPIPRIDSSSELVLRQYADATTLEGSGQNFLEFEVTRLIKDCDLNIICTANFEQENAIIAALYEGR